MHKLSAISKIDTIVDSDLLKQVKAILDVDVTELSIKEWCVHALYATNFLLSVLSSISLTLATGVSMKERLGDHKIEIRNN